MDKVLQKEIAIQCLEKLDIYKPYIKKFKSEAGAPCFFENFGGFYADQEPELYKKIDEVAIAQRPNNRAMESALVAGDLGKVAENLCNVFDPVVTEDHLELNYIKSIFNSYGAVGFQMTGSGSAVFAIMASFEHAAVACNMLKDSYPGIFIAKPV